MVGDVTRMPFRCRSFDTVLDKGTSDTLFFRNANKYRCALVTAMWSEVERVLGDEGVYVNITPRQRVPWLKELFPPEKGWERERIDFTFDPEQLENCLQLKLEDPRKGQERKETVFVHTYRRTQGNPDAEAGGSAAAEGSTQEEQAKSKAERRAHRRAASAVAGEGPAAAGGGGVPGPGE